ncbi:MAG TPA: hypothetical protein VJZ06_06715 [Mobilitalea sp.]|nr:hypothetical protein [Mobilitalea sp.]
MEIRKAGIEDLDALFACRIEFLLDMKNHEIEIAEDFQKDTYDYMKDHILREDRASRRRGR